MPLVYEEYASKVIRRKNLDLELDETNKGVEVHLTKIAHSLDDIHQLTPALNLRPIYLDDIKKKFPSDPRSQRCELLREWKKQHGLEATYACLLKACVETSNANAARTIFEVLNAIPARRSVADPPTGDIENSDFDTTDYEEPFPCPEDKESAEYKELTDFSNEVEIILQTVLDEEYQAALTMMEPPSTKFTKAVSFPNAGMVVGMFAKRKMVLIKTENGQDVLYKAHSAIATFTGAKYIISIGTCYAFNKEIKIGDIIVSTEITSLKMQYKEDTLIFERNNTTEVKDDLTNIFCVQDTEVPNNGRHSNVHSGKFISFPTFLDRDKMHGKFQDVIGGAIGGEKEGGTLMQFQKRGIIKGVILIKGVVDYGAGDHVKNRECYLTASTNAVNYLKSKLEGCQNEFISQYNSLPRRDHTQNLLAIYEDEHPIFSGKQQLDLYQMRMPKPCPSHDSPEYHSLCEFSKKIQIILQTANQNEFQAAASEMEPLPDFSHPFFFQSACIVIGMFGKNKAAVIQTGSGTKAYDEVKAAIQYFPNVKYVIGVGVSHAFDMLKYRPGDVLVSSMISDLKNSKLQGGEFTDRGQTVDVITELTKIFCRNLIFTDDFPVSNTGRVSKVYSGKYASYPALVNDKNYREKIQAAVPEVIGGDMESGELLQLQQQGRIDGVIVIKAVVDYNDVVKAKEWQFTSTRAALTYAKSQLDLVPFRDPDQRITPSDIKAKMRRWLRMLRNQWKQEHTVIGAFSTTAISVMIFYVQSYVAVLIFVFFVVVCLVYLSRKRSN